MKNSVRRHVVAEIRKRENVLIRISDCDLGGFRYGEIRQFYRDSFGEYVASKKGVTFSPELIGEIAAGLEQLKDGFETTTTQ